MNWYAIRQKLHRAVGRRADDKALVFGDDTEASPLDFVGKVAVFHIFPPTPDVAALFKIDYNDAAAIANLLEDPVSLCIAGGLRFKIQNFCTEYGKSHGTSNKHQFVFYGVLLTSLLVSLFIRIHFIFWIGVAFLAAGLADKAHKTSKTFLDSKHQFWRSWEDSDLKAELSEVLARCGYFFEIETEEHRWKLSLYKGEVTSLPPKEDDESAQKLWDTRLNLEYRYVNDQSTFDTNDDMPPIPLDLWMIRGFFLGRTLIRATSKATKIFVAVTTICFYVSLSLIPSMLTLWFLLVYFMGTVWAIIVDVSSYHIAAEVLCRRLSPLIQDRYAGHSLVFETRPIKNCCGMKRGVFVLETCMFSKVSGSVEYHTVMNEPTVELAS